jgi:hypothetical protein
MIQNDEAVGGRRGGEEGSVMSSELFVAQGSWLFLRVIEQSRGRD